MHHSKGLSCEMIKNCLLPLTDDVNRILNPLVNLVLTLKRLLVKLIKKK